ncbi:flavin reductase family protein [Actinokineospora sp. HUAS TT18]|uniref:flavin reductase family protein n=1 Tax=Actinokineospora sp. HUAS TT18 TaxID=3447451 RepID=UPI003F51FB9E
MVTNPGPGRHLSAAPQESTTPATLRQVMGQFATGITVITAGGPLGHGMTANSFTSVSLEPPLVLCCVARTARMHQAILAAGGYGVSILGAEQTTLARYFADKTRPAGPSQFDAVDWVPGRQTGAPLLMGALAWLECTLTNDYEGGDHSIFVGEVLEAQRGGGRDALMFFSGGFLQAAPPPAKTA